MGEAAGRARAARELTRMGMHKEAKAIMTVGTLFKWFWN